jgi:hypothetical protein
VSFGVRIRKEILKRAPEKRAKSPPRRVGLSEQVTLQDHEKEFLGQVLGVAD